MGAGTRPIHNRELVGTSYHFTLASGQAKAQMGRGFPNLQIRYGPASDLAVLHGLMSLDLIKTNMHKVFIVFFYTVFALLVFVHRGDVIWWMGLVVAAGNALGAWLGTHFAVKKGEKLIRVVLLLAMAVKLIFFS